MSNSRCASNAISDTSSKDTKQNANSTVTHKNVPRNWPEDITYLSAPEYSDNVLSSENILSQLRLQGSQIQRDSVVFTATGAPIPCVRIAPILDSRHPAHGQHGLFTTRHLAPDASILPYFGLVHSTTPEDTDESSDYDLSLDRDLMVAIDAAHKGNEARFMNDYRGVPRSAGTLKGPNAEFRDVWIEVEEGIMEKGIGVFVLTAGKSGLRKGGIKSGEEILVNYGKGFWNHRTGASSKLEHDINMGDEQ